VDLSTLDACLVRGPPLVSLGMKNEALKGHLDLLLLNVLRDQPAHGYQIAVALRESSRGAFDLPEGTIYPALHRLEQQGLLASEWDDQGSRRRRVYRMTRQGRDAMRVQQVEWTRFVRGVHDVLGTFA
jgi:PadR family transcriptional regulator PadR